VRAVTRDPDSDKARELANAGAELVQADIDDPESMRKALEGAYGAFFVTFFWAHLSPEKALAEAKNMANAAKAANIKHAIWSTLEDTRKFVPLSDNRMPTLMEKYKVPHFDAKGEADQFFKDSGVPVTCLLTTFYWDNLVGFGMGPKPGAEGKLVFTLPMGDQKMAGMASEDIGKCAYGIFKRGTEFQNKTIGIAGELLSGSEMAEKLGKALNKEVMYQAIEPETYRSFGFPGAEDLGNMFQFYRDFSDHFAKSRDLKLSRELNPELQDFDAWLNKNAAKIPVE